jgi:flagellar biosynthesis/type III secretory pathway M-ring protein FliF/YscJ
MEPPAPPALPAGKTSPQQNTPGWKGRLPIDQKLLLPVAVAAGLLLLIFIGVVILLLRSRKKSRTAEAQPALPAGQGDTKAIDKGLSPVAQMEAMIAERENQQRLAEAEAINTLKLPPVVTKKAEVLTKHLRENIKKEPALAAQVLVGWMREEP